LHQLSSVHAVGIRIVQKASPLSMTAFKAVSDAWQPRNGSLHRLVYDLGDKAPAGGWIPG
jgi:hypothetical protein